MAEYADSVHRILAVIIDHIILAVIALIIILPLGFSTFMYAAVQNPFMAMATAASWIAAMLVITIMGLLYFSYFESNTGQTPGKKVMGIKVVKVNGKKLSFGDALVRTIFRLLDALPFAYILGLIIILVSEKKQRIGDMAAKTVVVKA